MMDNIKEFLTLSISFEWHSAHKADFQYHSTNTFCCHKMSNLPCFGLLNISGGFCF